jgi:hypothetical protein
MGSSTLQVVDGRRARNPDGTLTRDPVRSCHLWLPAQEEAVLVSAVAVAASGLPGAVMIQPAVVEERARIVACLPLASGRTAVVRALFFTGRTSGVSVREQIAPPAACVR